MAVCNIIPHQFTADDVRDTLNANGGSVGNNWLDYFGAGANVRPYSYYKPNKRYRVNFVDDESRATADNQRFGIHVLPVSFSLTNPDELTDTAKTWSYDKPTGGVDYPYRLGDFRGYNAKAVEPIGVTLPTDLYRTKNGKLFINEIDKEGIGASSGGQLGLNDILGFDVTYIGVLVVNNNNTKGYWYSTNAAGARDLDIDLLTKPFYQDSTFYNNVKVYCFLCDYYQVGWSNVIPIGMKTYLPIRPAYKVYPNVYGDLAELPDCSVKLSSVSPTTVTWQEATGLVIATFTFTLANGFTAPANNTLRFRVDSFAGGTSTFDAEYGKGYTWTSLGGGKYKMTTDIFDTLAIDKNGNPPPKPSGPRISSITAFERIPASNPGGGEQAVYVSVGEVGITIRG